MHQATLSRPHASPQENPQIRPSQSMQMNAPLRPMGSMQPTGALRPMGSMQPTGALRPMGSMQPTGALRPMGSMQPTGALRPMGSMQPTGALRPMGSMQPTGALRPMGSMQRMGSLRPMGSMQRMGSLRPMVSMRALPSAQANAMTRSNEGVTKNGPQGFTGHIQPSASVRYNGPLQPDPSPRPNASMQRTASMRPMGPLLPRPPLQSGDAFRPLVPPGPQSLLPQNSMSKTPATPQLSSAQRAPLTQQTSSLKESSSIEKKNEMPQSHTVDKKQGSVPDQVSPEGLVASQMAVKKHNGDASSNTPLQNNMATKSLTISRPSPTSDPKNQGQQLKHLVSSSNMQPQSTMGKLPPRPPMNQPASRKEDPANMSSNQRPYPYADANANLMNNVPNANVPQNMATANQSKRTPYTNNSSTNPKLEQVPILQQRGQTSENLKKYTPNLTSADGNNTETARLLENRNANGVNNIRSNAPLYGLEKNTSARKGIPPSQDKLFSTSLNTEKNAAASHPDAPLQKQPNEPSQRTYENEVDGINPSNISSYSEDLQNTKPSHTDSKKFDNTKPDPTQPQQMLKVSQPSNPYKAKPKDFYVPQLVQSSENSGLTTQLKKKSTVCVQPLKNKHFAKQESFSYQQSSLQNKQSDQDLYENGINLKNSEIAKKKSFLKQMPPSKNTSVDSKQPAPTSEKSKSVGSSIPLNKESIEDSQPNASQNVSSSVRNDSLHSSKFSSNAKLLKQTDVKPSKSSIYQKASVKPPLKNLKSDPSKSTNRSSTIQTKGSNDTNNGIPTKFHFGDRKDNAFGNHLEDISLRKTFHSGQATYPFGSDEESKLYDININSNGNISRGVQTYEYSATDRCQITRYGNASANLVGMPCINQLCMLTKNNQSKLMCVQDGCIHNSDSEHFLLPKTSRMPVNSSCFALQAANNRHLCISEDINMYKLYNDCLLPRKSIYVDPQKLLSWTSRVPFTLQETYLYEDLTKGFNEYWEEVN